MKEKIGGLREMKRKMVVWFMTAAAALVCMTGCSAEKQEKTSGQQMGKAQEDTRESITLNVFAAASMTETLEMIQKMYEEESSDVALVFNFDSSGTKSRSSSFTEGSAWLSIWSICFWAAEINKSQSAPS